jgi:hypothetical protein
MSKLSPSSWGEFLLRVVVGAVSRCGDAGGYGSLGTLRGLYPNTIDVGPIR